MKIPTDMLKGTIHKTNNSGCLEVVEFVSAINVIVKFNGYDHVQKTRSSHIRNGEVRNKMLPVVFGVGFVGIGSYSITKDRKAYYTWVGMLTRCYSSKLHLKHPTYKGCSISSEWHNFQAFSVWFYDNHQKGLHLDKDILVQGNKVYSPKTCLFVTRRINLLLNDNKASRGIYSQGVHFQKKSGKFQAFLSENSKKVHLGYFDDEKSAFEAYCERKYIYIKGIALQQTDPLKSALLAYRVQ